MTYEYTAEDIAAIRERAEFKWESNGVESFAAVYRDGERSDYNFADVELAEGDHVTRLQLSRLADAPEPSSAATVADRLTIDANVFPFATVWWIDGEAYVAHELVDAPTSDTKPEEGEVAVGEAALRRAFDTCGDALAELMRDIVGKDDEFDAVLSAFEAYSAECARQAGYIATVMRDGVVSHDLIRPAR
jgi:hypothetical protein